VVEEEEFEVSSEAMLEAQGRGEEKIEP